MPRAGLTRQIVVDAAAILADDVGYDELTLAALAKRLGVALPSLYKHVAGLEAVKAELGLLATRELGEALGRAGVGRAQGDALRGVAAAYRSYVTQHPGRYAATVRAVAPDDHLAAERLAASEVAVGVLFAVLEGYGLTGPDLVDAARAVRSSLHGFSVLENAGGFGLPRDVSRSFDALVDGLDTALRSWGLDAVVPTAPVGPRG